MKYSVDYVKDLYDSNQNLKYVFFWGHRPALDGSITKTCFSQWYDCHFTIDGIQYHTTEQYMMAQKATLFEDTATLRRIMNATRPNEYKRLGREVRGFDVDVWKEHQTDIVIDGNLAKFSQNRALRDFILCTHDRILVEASPYDTIWGIGLRSGAHNIKNPYYWKGSNLLGFCLMEVRDALSKENTTH